MRSKLIIELIAIALTLIASIAAESQLAYSEQSTTGNCIVVVHITGTITYGTSELVNEAIAFSTNRRCPLILVLDTPGGLLDATIEIISLVRRSSIPIVGYVYPPGKGAWSAGTLILLSTHIAAMTPGTFIGSLQPVELTSTGYQPVNESKIINVVVEQARSLARDRNRNVSIAERFVLENLNLEASEAKKLGVVELTPTSLSELIEELNGFEVKLDSGIKVVIELNKPEVIHYEGGLRPLIMHILSDPVINGLIASIGVMTFFIGLFTGHHLLIPIGLALILLSLIGYGYNANYISLVIMMLGGILLAIELLVIPGFGVIGYTGIALLIIGLMLAPITTPGYLVTPETYLSITLLATSIALSLGGFVTLVLYKIVKVRRRKHMIMEKPVGLTGRALDELQPNSEGFVIVEGEYWRAKSRSYIKSGEKIIVIDKEGPILIVDKAK